MGLSIAIDGQASQLPQTSPRSSTRAPRDCLEERAWSQASVERQDGYRGRDRLPHEAPKADRGVVDQEIWFSIHEGPQAPVGSYGARVWSDRAKDETRKAAMNAGMSEGLTVISESEAGAVYTLQAIQPNYLQEGDNLINVDAGGGTVDLISYVSLQRCNHVSFI